MNAENLINRLIQHFSWLYHNGQWQRWDLLTIAITALVLLLLAGRAQRKGSTDVKRMRGRSPMIGIRLAEHREGR